MKGTSMTTMIRQNVKRTSKEDTNDNDHYPTRENARKQDIPAADN